MTVRRRGPTPVTVPMHEPLFWRDSHLVFAVLIRLSYMSPKTGMTTSEYGQFIN